MPTVIIPEDRVPSLNRSIEQGFVKGGRPGQEGYIAGVEGESVKGWGSLRKITNGDI